MSSISSTAASEHEAPVSACLMMVLEAASALGGFLLVEPLLKVRLKPLKYSWLNKAPTRSLVGDRHARSALAGSGAVS